MNLLTTPTSCTHHSIHKAVHHWCTQYSRLLHPLHFTARTHSEEQLIENGVEIGLQSCMLKRHKIISKYFFWESQTFLSILSRWICIPEILVWWFQVLLLILSSQFCLQFLDLNFVGAYLQHVIHIQHQWSKHPFWCNRGLWRNQICGTNTWALSLNRTEICSTMQTKFSCSLTPSGWCIISFLLNNNLMGSGTHRWYPFTLLA